MKGKVILSALIAAVCATGSFAFAACGDGSDDKTTANPTEGLVYTLNTDGESYSVTGLGTATDTDIVISAEYEAKPVTEIGKEAFKACRNITSVVIPDSVTVIKTSAFSGCTQLKEIKFSSALEEIWQWAFYNCESLKDVTLPDSVMSVGSAAFSRENGTNRDDLLPELEYNIHQAGLYLGTASNPYHALVLMRQNNSLAIEVHKDTKVIADNVFSANSQNLNNIYFPQDLTGINVPRSVFMGLHNLQYHYQGGDYLGSTPKGGSAEYPVVLCFRTANGKFADGVKIITSDGFKALIDETEIVVPDGVDSIGEYAFYGFNKLEKVTLPASLTLIPRNVFNKCTELTDVTYKGTTLQWNALKKSMDWSNGAPTFTVHCSDGDVTNN